MKSHARVAIVGGGIMGVGLQYHLAREGWTELVLLEKSELTSGSTWHAAGQYPHFIGSLNAANLHVYGTQLDSSLEARTGQAVSRLRLACTDERWTGLNRCSACRSSPAMKRVSPARVRFPATTISLRARSNRSRACGATTQRRACTGPERRAAAGEHGEDHPLLRRPEMR